jgi:hypothetical protein
MSNIFFANDEECLKKINMDDLFEKNMRRKEKSLSIFNKILSRIHKRIKSVSRMKSYDKHAWYTIPQYIFGEPNFDQGDCVAHIIAKLVDNGFFVKYVHPNTLFISWDQWIPEYVRLEYKNRTGIVINERGQVSEKNIEVEANVVTLKEKEEKKFTSINTYKPTGNLVYNPDMFQAFSNRNKNDI